MSTRKFDKAVRRFMGGVLEFEIAAARMAAAQGDRDAALWEGRLKAARADVMTGDIVDTAADVVSCAMFIEDRARAMKDGRPASGTVADRVRKIMCR